MQEPPAPDARPQWPDQAAFPDQVSGAAPRGGAEGSPASVWPPTQLWLSGQPAGTGEPDRPDGTDRLDAPDRSGGEDGGTVHGNLSELFRRRSGGPEQRVPPAPAGAESGSRFPDDTQTLGNVVRLPSAPAQDETRHGETPADGPQTGGTWPDGTRYGEPRHGESRHEGGRHEPAADITESPTPAMSPAAPPAGPEAVHDPEAVPAVRSPESPAGPGSAGEIHRRPGPVPAGVESLGLGAHATDEFPRWGTGLVPQLEAQPVGRPEAQPVGRADATRTDELPILPPVPAGRHGAPDEPAARGEASSLPGSPSEDDIGRDPLPRRPASGAVPGREGRGKVSEPVPSWLELLRADGERATQQPDRAPTPPAGTAPAPPGSGPGTSPGLETGPEIGSVRVEPDQRSVPAAPGTRPDVQLDRPDAEPDIMRYVEASAAPAPAGAAEPLEHGPADGSASDPVAREATRRAARQATDRRARQVTDPLERETADRQARAAGRRRGAERRTGDSAGDSAGDSVGPWPVDRAEPPPADTPSPPSSPPPLDADAATVLTTVRELPGVRNAELVGEPGRQQVLRLDLVASVDPHLVGQQAEAILRDQLGVHTAWWSRTEPQQRESRARRGEQRPGAGPFERSGPAISVEQVQVVTAGLEAAVEVGLAVAGMRVAGRASGPAHDWHVLRSAVTATTEALGMLLAGRARLALEYAELVPAGPSKVAVVSLLLVSGAGAERVAGAAPVRGEAPDAAVAATIAAVRQRLSALLDDAAIGR